MKAVVWTFALVGPSVAFADDAPSTVQKPAYVITLSQASSKRLQLVLEARGGFHLNDDYPLHFTPAEVPGVRFDRSRIDRDAMALVQCKAEKAHLCGATIPVGFSAERGGVAQLGGTVAFSACDADQCLIEKVPLSTKVTLAR